MTYFIVCICAILFLLVFATKKKTKAVKIKPMTQRTQDSYDEVKSLLDEAIMMLDEMQGDGR